MSADKDDKFRTGEQDFSLSSALRAVSQQGESQALELREKQQVLESVQITLSVISASYETVVRNIKLKERQTSGIICEVEQVHCHNETQETEIKTILVENMRLRHNIEEELEKSRFLLARYNTYRKKMENYKTSASEMESQAPIYKELMEKGEEVKRLKECRDELKMDLENPEGNAVRQAQKKLDNLKDKIRCTKELVREKMMLLQKEKITHSQLRKDIEIHNKRCEAIVKRLRCQVNQAQSSHRQVSSDILHMEKEVEHLRKQLQISHSM